MRTASPLIQIENVREGFWVFGHGRKQSFSTVSARSGHIRSSYIHTPKAVAFHVSEAWAGIS